MPVLSKICPRCETLLPAESFGRCATHEDGLQWMCKSCKAIYRKGRRTHRREYNNTYRSTELGKKNRHFEYVRRKATHPQRERAWDALHAAVISGVVVKQKCTVCRDPESQAHHDDYNKPLEVIWLCHAHHCAVHGKEAAV